MEPEEIQNHIQTGKMGEAMAEKYLLEKGYEIVARNFVAARVEIDLICRKDKLWVFVEVKTRHQALVQPELAVNFAKQRNMARAASTFLNRFQISDPIRFDIIAINIFKGNTDIAHFEDAFYPVFYK